MEKRARKGEEKENPRGSPPRRKRQGGYYFGILDAECVMGLSKRRKRIVLFVGCREGGGEDVYELVKKVVNGGNGVVWLGYGVRGGCR